MNCKTTDAGNAQANAPRWVISPVVFILLVLFGISRAAHGQNASLQIRLEKALENARAITNVEIQYDDILWLKGKPISVAESNEWTRTMRTSYPFSSDYIIASGFEGGVNFPEVVNQQLEAGRKQ